MSWPVGGVKVRDKGLQLGLGLGAADYSVMGHCEYIISGSAKPAWIL